MAPKLRPTRIGIDHVIALTSFGPSTDEVIRPMENRASETLAGLR